MYVGEKLSDIPDDMWCILRCAGRATFRLAGSLANKGYETWAPQRIKRTRIPKLNIRTDVPVPLLPSYVFAKANRLPELLELSKINFPQFFVMRCSDKLPLIADRDLDGLRTLETRPRPPKTDFAFKATAHVKMDDGAFGGMVGCVERSDARYTLVCFDDKYTVKIATRLLKYG